MQCKSLIAIAWMVFVLTAHIHAVAQSSDEERAIPLTGPDPLEVRFRCSIQILKDLNEKILSLDHHFASLRAHKEVFDLSNPLNYPEFTAVQEYVKQDLKSKHAVDVPEFLGQNAVFASAWTLVSLVLSDKPQSEKTETLQDISCLMDFTMRIQNDLNIIYYETDFLHDTNTELGKKCCSLFTESCKLIGYDLPLQQCREQDDWEHVYENCTATFHGLNVLEQDPGLISKVNKERNDLRFRIDLTVQFIQEYSAMIAQGIQHYQKFEKILERYEQETFCANSLPPAFKQLKEDVETTLKKFQTAYQMPELSGSRLKMLMYASRE